jgi:hypothetical protein
VDTRITGARPVESPRTFARGRPLARPDADALLLALTVATILALTVAFVACVGAALAAACCHVVCWPVSLVLAFFVLLSLYDVCMRW